MPGLSGTQLIAELRARSSARIYVVSGSNPPPEVAAAADGFLLKPFTPRPSASCSRAASRRQPTPSMLRLWPMSRSSARNSRAVPQADARARGARRFTRPSSPISAGASRRSRPPLPEATAPRSGASATPSKAAAAWPEPFRPPGWARCSRHAPLDPQDNQLDNSAALLSDLRAAARGLERMLDAELPA